MASEASAPVTVVIPTRDRGDRVVQALESLLGGEYGSIEVRIIDQSRNDATEAAVMRLAGDPRVRYERSATRGLSAGLNRGIAVAAGEIVAITGDDCTAAPDWLKSLVAAFTLEPCIGVVFGNVLPGPHDHTRGFVPAFVRTGAVLARGLRDKHLVAGTSASMALRKSVWHVLSGFDETFGLGAPMRAGEDVDLTIRALRRGYAIYETPAAAVVHHGFFGWHGRRALIDRNWFGAGAAFAKPIRQGEAAIVPVLAALARRWATGGSSPIAASLGLPSARWSILAGFARGLAAGACTPVDRASGHYRRR